MIVTFEYKSNEKRVIYLHSEFEYRINILDKIKFYEILDAHTIYMKEMCKIDFDGKKQLKELQKYAIKRDSVFIVIESHLNLKTQRLGNRGGITVRLALFS